MLDKEIISFFPEIEKDISTKGLSRNYLNLSLADTKGYTISNLYSIAVLECSHTLFNFKKGVINHLKHAEDEYFLKHIYSIAAELGNIEQLKKIDNICDKLVKNHLIFSSSMSPISYHKDLVFNKEYFKGFIISFSEILGTMKKTPLNFTRINNYFRISEEIKLDIDNKKEIIVYEFRE